MYKMKKVNHLEATYLLGAVKIIGELRKGRL